MMNGNGAERVERRVKKRVEEEERRVMGCSNSKEVHALATEILEDRPDSSTGNTYDEDIFSDTEERMRAGTCFIPRSC